MIIKCTLHEGGFWQEIKVSRKELNFMLKHHCLYTLPEITFKAIKIKSRIYDFILFPYLHTYYRKEYK